MALSAPKPPPNFFISKGNDKRRPSSFKAITSRQPSVCIAVVIVFSPAGKSSPGIARQLLTELNTHSSYMF